MKMVLKTATLSVALAMTLHFLGFISTITPSRVLPQDDSY